MLRMMFGEPPRRADGPLAETMREMDRYIEILQKAIARGEDRDRKLRKYEIWTQGLKRSLDELEQSHYAACRFGSKVTSEFEDDMSPEEHLDYCRHVYFDKNGFIRLFSILDKLGTFLNDCLGLETERLKPHFSYFTVLRRMRQEGLHPKLLMPLDELKKRYRQPVDRLRERRNIEIHNMNAELRDDLVHSVRAYGEDVRLENIRQHMEDLTEGLTFAIESLRIAFQYVARSANAE